MSIKKKFNLYLDDIYWNLKAGKSKKKATIYEIRSNINEYIKSPVFFLSTGRCGTQWFTELLKQDRQNFVIHNPIPSLAIQSKLMYELFNKDIKQCTINEKKLALEIFLSGREQYLRYSYKTGKRYIETNNYITFFAPILIELFPDIKFVHLYRHPGEFVRSGIRRKYYTNSFDDKKRITPSKDSLYYKKWGTLSQLEKVSWLWNETNLFIENFKNKYPENYIDFNFNNLSLNNTNNLLNFLEIKIKDTIISQSLKIKTNIQKDGTFQKYDKWNQNKKEKLAYICSDLLKHYNYSI